MNTLSSKTLAGALVALALPVGAQEDPTSTSYRSFAASFSGGGGAGSSANYELSTSLEPLGNSGSSANYRIEAGWTGVQFRVTGLTLEVTPTVIEEGETARLNAVATLDDLSLLAVDPDEIHWAVEFEGFIVYGNPIQVGGVLAPLDVERDSAVTLVGEYRGVTGRTELTVLVVTDVDSYVAWARRYFDDPREARAQPEADPDGDSIVNSFERLIGYIPIEPNYGSFFHIENVRNNVVEFRIEKVIPGRTYTLRAGRDMRTFPEVVASFSVREEERNYLVEDRQATANRKFYRLEVTE